MAGVIAMDTSCAGETVRVVDSVTVPDIADIVVTPTVALSYDPRRGNQSDRASGRTPSNSRG